MLHIFFDICLIYLLFIDVRFPATIFAPPSLVCVELTPPRVPEIETTDAVGSANSNFRLRPTTSTIAITFNPPAPVNTTAISGGAHGAAVTLATVHQQQTVGLVSSKTTASFTSDSVSGGPASESFDVGELGVATVEEESSTETGDADKDLRAGGPIQGEGCYAGGSRSFSGGMLTCTNFLGVIFLNDNFTHRKMLSDIVSF